MKKSKLKLLGVIGDPISHSLSPLMHNAALAHLKLPYLYMPWRVTPKDLKKFIRSLPQRNIAGINVTIPHKQSVLPLMDSLSREAKLIGAVNTVIVKGKKLIGNNTDGTGYLASLKKEAGFDVAKKKVILVGAGGAARAIGVALGLKKAREVYIINKPASMAYDLAKKLNRDFPQTTYGASPLDSLDMFFWSSANLLINASAMGMKGIKLWPAPLAKLSRKTLISDIIYNPLETPLFKRAKRLKLKTHPGWGMLLYQGALSFEMWTGKKAPIRVMKEALLEALR